MMIQQYSITGACFILVAWLIWQEIKRSNKVRLLPRIIATVLAAASLYILAIPISFTAASSGTAEKEVALLTEGYNKDSLDNFLKQNAHVSVHNADEYEQQPGSIGKLHVFGYGLSKNEWQLLQPSQIVFHPSPAGNGITAVGYDKKINSGDVLIIQGKFNNITNRPIKLLLNGFKTPFDSVIINPGLQQSFALQTIPKFVGRAVYYLTAVINKDTIANEPLPVEARPVQPLKILILSAFPDFENKFLQNWLLENNYVVAARTSISKNKYSISFTDTSSFSLDHITPNILASFDVLIADATVLSALSRQELFNIKNEISENGLGLILKADTTEKPGLFYDNSCSIVSAANNKQVLSVQLPGSDTVSALPVENPLFIHPGDNVQHLISDNKKNVLACKAVYGMGSIVFSTFNNTYYWMLSGDKKSYRLLWSSLIEKVAKKKQANTEWNVFPAFPVTNEPVTLTATSPGDDYFKASVDESFISFKATPYMPFEWQGTYWPDKKGWRPVVSANGEIAWFYVFDKNAWKNIAALQKINDTYAYASANKNLFHGDAVKNSSRKKTIPAFYFFILFACSCIFLWVEKKLS